MNIWAILSVMELACCDKQTAIKHLFVESDIHQAVLNIQKERMYV